MTEEIRTKGLEPGEKWLAISLLNGAIKVAAFPNRNKKSQQDPDFTSGGIAVWVNEKRAKVESSSL